MSFFSKLFKNNSENTEVSAKTAEAEPEPSINSAKDTNKSVGQSVAEEQGLSETASREDALIQIFSNYFAPNTGFYSQPGSDKFKAYFGAIDAAKREMLEVPALFTQATGWLLPELLEILNDPVPGVTNMLVCALIFTVGEYAVGKSFLYCVDFCEYIPNCIALYLLLIAQKDPADKRKQLIDAGDGVNPIKLQQALDALAVCDGNWKYTIM